MPPTIVLDGTTDLYIRPECFQEVFCADVAESEAAKLAVTQRPATQEALVEPSGESPLWKRVPSWFLIGEEDRIIPAALQHFMAERANARDTIEIPGVSHGATISKSDTVAALVLDVARAPAAA